MRQDMCIILFPLRQEEGELQTYLRNEVPMRPSHHHVGTCARYERNIPETINAMVKQLSKRAGRSSPASLLAIHTYE
jgi:3-methyladenine DNA glycosylase Tag